MTSNIVNRAPYLRTSRSFSEDPRTLSTELNKTYVDIANIVNYKTNSLYALNRDSITGERWFIDTQHQTLRKTFGFTSTGAIVHNIRFTRTLSIVRGFGSYTDGTNNFGLIFGTSGEITNQITFHVTSTQIVFFSSGTAPALTEGLLTIEWLSAP